MRRSSWPFTADLAPPKRPRCAIAKVFGKGAGLDELRETMSGRFDRTSKRRAPAAG